MKHTTKGGKHGYCSIHVLANVLHDSNFDLYLDDSKYECATTEKQNEILEHEGYDFSLYDVVNFPSNILLDKALFLKIVSTDYFSYFKDMNLKYPVIPFFLTVKPIGVDFYHATALIRSKDRWWYSDSNNDEMIELNSPDEVFGHFDLCSGISMIHVKNGNDYNVGVLLGEIFGYSTDNSENIINYSGVSKMLTNDRTAIRSTYDGKKYKEAVNEISQFEKQWISKYKKF